MTNNQCRDGLEQHRRELQEMKLIGQKLHKSVLGGLLHVSAKSPHVDSNMIVMALDLSNGEEDLPNVGDDDEGNLLVPKPTSSRLIRPFQEGEAQLDIRSAMTNGASRDGI